MASTTAEKHETPSHSEHEKGDLSAPPSHEGHSLAYNDVEKSPGVLTAEAAAAIVGWKIWAVYLGIALTAYVTGLDNNTMVSRDGLRACDKTDD